MHGSDPDWGRVAMAIGKLHEETDIKPARVRIQFGDLVMHPEEPSDELLGQAAAGVTTVHQATPLTWRMLLADGWRGRLRTALCGGEAMHPDLAAALDERCDEVWNTYGSTAHRVTSADTARVPVGHPLPDTEVLVLDMDLARAERGAVGEIWIGGTGVGLGYRGRDELSADRFRPRPLGPPGERIYRTGDLGRRRADPRADSRADRRADLGRASECFSRPVRVMSRQNTFFRASAPGRVR